MAEFHIVIISYAKMVIGPLIVELVPRTQETHQEMRYSNVTALCFVTFVAFNAPDGGVPWDDFRKILHRG